MISIVSKKVSPQKNRYASLLFFVSKAAIHYFSFIIDNTLGVLTAPFNFQNKYKYELN